MAYRQMVTKQLAAPEAKPGTTPPPDLVPHAAFVEALRPLLALIGVDDPNAIYADQFLVTGDRIEYVSIAPVPDVEPIEIGSGEAACWGWPVAVEVQL